MKQTRMIKADAIHVRVNPELYALVTRRSRGTTMTAVVEQALELLLAAEAILEGKRS